ncbi:cadherin-like domain-containing protein, partial [Sphingomonas sp. CCH10-B3]
TANGGVNLDASPNTLTFNVTPVNDAPSGTDATLTILEDMPRTLTTADFGFSDAEGNSFAAVVITTLPSAGSLTLNGVALTAGQSIPVASLPQLVFTPAANASGNGYASFTFQVQDNGGTANGGVNLDASP